MTNQHKDLSDSAAEATGRCIRGMLKRKLRTVMKEPVERKLDITIETGIIETKNIETMERTHPL
jgi:hypothetical protein